MGFMDAMAAREQTIETAERPSRQTLSAWFAEARGVALGYYYAGGVSKFECDAAIAHLRRTHRARLAELELIEQAIAEGTR